MKNRFNYNNGLSTVLIFALIMISQSVMGQVDSVKVLQTDSVKVASTDASAAEEKKKKKVKKDAFLIYGGANINNVNVSNASFDTDGGLGYHLGVAYKRGSFFYWQVGARYNRAVYNLMSVSTTADTSKLTVNAVDLPLTAGINFLSFMDRLVGVRVFVSAVPSFTLGVGDNDVKVTKEDINSFIMYGQAGLGVDIAFVMIEVGYNYGFNDLLKNYANSNPGQAFASIGFRF